MAEKNSKNLNYVFWGTALFGAIILEELVKNNLFPHAVITQPDKPQGRGKKVSFSPVKEISLKYNLKVLQPEDISNNLQFVNLLKKFKPELFILAGYGKILPLEIINLPQFGSLNIHPSLLPKYRGASPVQFTILNNDKITGISIILMDEKMDHGPIVAQEKIKINPKSITAPELSSKLAYLSAKTLLKTIPLWLNKKITPIPQKDSQATYTKIIQKKHGEINWNNSAEFIERMTRAFTPWPSAYTKWDNKIIKILKAKVVKNQIKKTTPGRVFLNENKEFCIGTGQGILIVEKIQIQGKKPVSAKDFLNGYQQIIGAILG
ncbi:methionyl-tRNA formyltransferase [bacterium]|nr:methionyl-tRNA formyltransferase [bacterium]